MRQRPPAKVRCEVCNKAHPEGNPCKKSKGKHPDKPTKERK